jgi:hypothetical protein
MVLALVVSAGCGGSDDDPAGAGAGTTTTGAPGPIDTPDPGEEAQRDTDDDDDGDGDEAEAEGDAADEADDTRDDDDGADSDGDGDGDDQAEGPDDDGEGTGDGGEPEGADDPDGDDGADSPGDDNGSGPTDESPTTTEALPEDAVVYEAPIGNEREEGDEDDSTLTVAESDDSIHRFAVEGLVVDCFPLGAGEQETRTVDVTMEDVPVGEGRMVDHGEPELPYSPVLSGLFTDDGEFIGSLELSSEEDGFLCGGEFTFAADS